jgi:hypothetical protein
MLKKPILILLGILFVFSFSFVNSISGSSSSGGVGEFSENGLNKDGVSFFEDFYSGEMNAFIFLTLVFIIIAGIIFWKRKISRK